jgi:RHS repeat-associated protein
MASQQLPKSDRLNDGSQIGTRSLNLWNPFDKNQKGSDVNGISSSKEPNNSSPQATKASYYASQAPTISAPSGGGALKSIDEKFEVNPVSGTCSLSVPFPISPGRNGMSPEISLTYDSGLGNSPFGLGWHFSLPSISRKTSKGLPRYNDERESDVFLFTGVEDLVPKMAHPVKGGESQFLETKHGDWTVRNYWPRTEGSFTRIERWSKQDNPADTYWKTISPSNVTSFFGETSNSKIMDTSSGRVFAWLLCLSYDTQGNAIEYSYKEEDSVGVRMDQAHELHRSTTSRSTNRYIKSIKYGNIQPNRDPDWNLRSVPVDGWMFEVAFDYGDHSADNMTTVPDVPWTVRDDPFSVYNAGFEVRTYRLCRRLLLFHHLKEELGIKDYLVRSMELSYNESGIVSVLSSIMLSGYGKEGSSGYIKRSIPPMKFDYHQVDLSMSSVEAVPSSALENLPAGLSSPLQWIDLDGIGKPSALYPHTDGWYYMRNLSSYQPSHESASTGAGKVEFGPAEPLRAIPSLGAEGNAAFLDLNGSGRLDLVREGLGEQGFYERTDEGGWTEFRTFPAWPTVDTSDPNLRYLDLTGDGLADILITEADTFLWYPALGTEGYGEGVRTFTGISEDDGPRIVFDNGLETIYLADFCGDGLVDLVRIRNGDICYWPNIGYGQFGAKVIMDNAPWMDPRDKYNKSRIKLADIDGSGVADLLYFPPEGGLKVYFNLAGNAWSEEVDVNFPLLDSLSEVNVLDLFGLGMSCIVWSTRVPASRLSCLQYLDFTHGIKPHLLTGYKNGPVETRMEYTSSVSFHQSDERNGRSWPTRLTYPVHCLSRVTTYDFLSRRYNTSSYTYHDGYHDGIEREFRGFGKVETTELECFLLQRNSSTWPSQTEVNGSSSLKSPPTRLVSWHHTGTYEGYNNARNLYKSEYFSSSSLADIAVSPQEPVITSGMGAMEVRQAYRALKGTPMHQETFLLDGSDKESIPFMIADNSSSVAILQRAVGNQPGVFIVTPREAVACQVDRNPADPKIQHDVTLETDSFGNITKSAKVNYGRGSSFHTPAYTADDWKAQQTIVTYTEHDFTNSISTQDDYHTPVAAETRTYEVTGLAPKSSLFDFEELSPGKIKALRPKDYTDESDSPGLRLVSRMQTRYRSNDLSEILDARVLESLALVSETYVLALTQDVLQDAFQSAKPQPLLSDQSILGDRGEDGGGYVDLENNKSWWVPSGKERMSQAPDATPAQELATARKSFFKPMCYIDPFGKAQTVTYDNYFMNVTGSTDVLGNTKSAVIDYHALKPRLYTDENGNQTAGAFDALGECVGIAVMGKEPSPLGDNLDQFQPFLDAPAFRELISNPLKVMESILGNGTSCSFSDFPTVSSETGWSPGFNISISRDMSITNLKADAIPNKLQVVVSYFEGNGTLLQKRTLVNNAPGQEQWVVSDLAINNGGSKAVRQYDAAFDSSHIFSHPTTTVFSTNFYDPFGRLVATVLPNHTWAKQVYSPWSQATYDPGDNVLVEDPVSDPDVGVYLSGLEDSSLLKATWYSTMKNSANSADQRAAELSASYANQPSTRLFDVLGQSFLVMKNNGKEGPFVSRSYRDVQGRVRRVIDREGRLVAVSKYDMMDTCVYSTSMEMGENVLLNDVSGMKIRSWNSRGIRQRICYDKLRRLTKWYIQTDQTPEIMVQKISYGEDQAVPEAKNLRGKVYQVFDQAAVATTNAYDHLTNPVQGTQQLVKEYKKEVNWNSSVELEDEKFTWSSTFDALGRLLTKTRTDGSIVQNVWNQQGLLASVLVNGTPTVNGSIIKDIEYNARGQRLVVSYGNGAKTRFQYDRKTFMVVAKQTTRDSTVLQDLRYTMDCLGRILQIDDLAQQDIFFRGDIIKPTRKFTYDVIGRLIVAEGREHLGQIDKNWISIPSGSAAGSKTSLPSDGRAMGNYTEVYKYSPEGNTLSLTHSLSDKAIPGWTRTYKYNEPSSLESGKFNNRLSSTVIGDAISTYKYEGTSGNVGLITSMSGFPLLQWDMFNRLQASSTQVVNNGGTPETTWYRYDFNNKRVRKVTERSAAPGQTPVRAKDHVYVNGAEVELFRKFDPTGSTVALERWSWHIAAGDSRAALIEANKDLELGSEFSNTVARYLINDHIQSVSLELDDVGNLLSFEEFSPYGATTYDAAATLKINKRYRFSSKERDTETGLYYFENRYLMPWLGRWLSPDPIGTQDGPNVYCYTGCDPVNKVDPTGQMFMFVDDHFTDMFDIDGSEPHFNPDTKNQQLGELLKAKKELSGLFQGKGCSIVLKYENPDKSVGFWVGRNIPFERHAEEEVFYQSNAEEIKVLSMMISLEPCYDKRYPGHCCRDFFTSAGRKYTDSNGKTAIRKFTPGANLTPVFFFEAQTEKGSSSSFIKMTNKMDRCDIRYRTGGTHGEEMIPLGKQFSSKRCCKLEKASPNDGYSNPVNYGGQQYIKPDDLVAMLTQSQSFTSKPISWNTAGVDQRVIDAVKAKLPGLHLWVNEK